MASLFSDKPGGFIPSKRRAIAAEGKRWSPSQRLDLMKLYLMTGNLATACAATNIPYRTAYKWKISSWWKEHLAELKAQKDFEVSARLDKIINKSLIEVEDRLERGDYVYNPKSGKMERKPVNLNTAHRVAVDLMERQDILEGRKIQGESQEIAVDKFIQLAEKFAELARKTHDKPPVLVTDVIVQEREETDALHDEREEGLQEGEQEVQLQAERTEEEELEDSSEEKSELLWSYDEG